MSGSTLSARVSVEALRHKLGASSEWALFDVREEGVFADGHLLTATSLPLSRLELLVPDLVPRRQTPIVLCGGTSLAERAAARLHEFGYANAATFPGEIADWHAAGFETYTGVHVPSKAFGEFVESRYQTPHMTAEELKERLDGGDDVLILDSRPLEEYRTRNIPGAIDVPGVELVYRIKDLVRSPSTLIVVNCGGRTRSIIGAQSLINAGVSNRVVALKNGTMGWHLAGYPLERGQSRRPLPSSADGTLWARAAAKEIARRFGVPSIDRSTLREWSVDSSRTLYQFDVRQPEEFAMGHIPGSRHVQGGQLIQETDRHIAVRNARVVLIDDDGVRAAVAGSWLRQMGFADVYVLHDGLIGEPLETGPWHPKIVGLYEVNAEELPVSELIASIAGGGVTVIDVSHSTSYRRGHIPGAYHTIRAQLGEALAVIPLGTRIVVTSEDGLLAHLAAPEAARLSGVPVSALAGGNEAWRAAGGEMETGTERWSVPPRDVWLKPFDQLQGKVEDRLNTYLSWEIGLLEQLERDGSLRFKFAELQRASGSHEVGSLAK